MMIQMKSKRMSDKKASDRDKSQNQKYLKIPLIKNNFFKNKLNHLIISINKNNLLILINLIINNIKIIII
jgi:hypothetical protein